MLLIQSDHLHLLIDSPALLRGVHWSLASDPLIHKQATSHIQPILAEILPRYNAFHCHTEV